MSITQTVLGTVALVITFGLIYFIFMFWGDKLIDRAGKPGNFYWILKTLPICVIIAVTLFWLGFVALVGIDQLWDVQYMSTEGMIPGMLSTAVIILGGSFISWTVALCKVLFKPSRKTRWVQYTKVFSFSCGSTLIIISVGTWLLKLINNF